MWPERRWMRVEFQFGVVGGSAGFKAYFDEAWAELAPAASPPRRTWYLPHHAVYQGSGDERKCQVLLDGAAPYDGTTLNSQLEVGPNLQIDLLRAFLCFRRLCVRLQADIKKIVEGRSGCLQISPVSLRAEDPQDHPSLFWADVLPLPGDGHREVACSTVPSVSTLSG
ncbi:hypothetical protein T03_14180 [Trichinella britovi]|uniref:Uncharacterized protein n=1 Tax=Trichinella britovi TaxID=45882 RepID=A0A0V1CBH4_TRIBR|nr:hypothetical protein T03_14180 [Trichinella britovi]